MVCCQYSHFTIHLSCGVAGVPGRVMRRTLGNSFPAQLNGSRKVIISVGHLRVSHVLGAQIILLSCGLFS